MPTDHPLPLTPMAAGLRQQVTTQLSAPAAALMPAGLRRTVELLAALVCVMAERIDTLQPPPKG